MTRLAYRANERAQRAFDASVAALRHKSIKPLSLYTKSSRVADKIVKLFGQVIFPRNLTAIEIFGLTDKHRLLFMVTER